MSINSVLSGADRERIYLGGPEISAYELKTQQLLWSKHVPEGTSWIHPLMTQDRIFQFTPRGIYEIDKQNGDIVRLFRGADMDSLGGNLLLTPKALVAVSNLAITAYPIENTNDSASSQPATKAEVAVGPFSALSARGCSADWKLTANTRHSFYHPRSAPMIRRSLFAPIVCLIGIASIANADEGGITVTATGEATVKPNRLEIEIKSVHSAELTGDAVVKYRDNLRRAKEAFEKLKIENLQVEDRGMNVANTAAGGNNQVINLGGGCARGGQAGSKHFQIATVGCVRRRQIIRRAID